MIERCTTGISGFDIITQGGFVKNSSNLLVGGAGSGKTTFMLQFLWNGAVTFNEPGIYCSFEPDIVETLYDGMSFGWDFAKLNEQDRVKFLRFSPRTSVNELKNELTKLISKYQAKRICLDPASILALNENDVGKIRENLFDLVSLMKRLKVTSILSSEFMEDEEGSVETGIWSKTDILKFLCDSVTILYERGLNKESDRALKIMKMRRTNHVRNPINMELTSTGINLVS